MTADLLLVISFCVSLFLIVLVRSEHNKYKLLDVFGIVSTDDLAQAQQKVDATLLTLAKDVDTADKALNLAFRRKYTKHIAYWSDQVLLAKVAFRTAHKLAMKNKFSVLGDYKNYL